MKSILYITGAIVLFLFITAIPFLNLVPPQYFRFWGEFGAYIGGVATPLSILVAIFAVRANTTMHQRQLEENQRQADAAEAQRSKEQKAKDILRRIEHAETEFNNVLEKNTIDTDPRGPDFSSVSIKDILFVATNIHLLRFIPKEEQLLKEYGDQPIAMANKDFRYYEAFNQCAIFFDRLNEYARTLEALTGSNIDSAYLRGRYRLAAHRLMNKGYRIRSWDDVGVLNKPEEIV